MPEFPGGQYALFKFISNNLNYPKDAKKKGIQGKVMVQFIVEKDGFWTIRSVSPDLDKEATRVFSLSSMPKWKPGMSDGVAVRVRYTFPITFKLD